MRFQSFLDRGLFGQAGALCAARGGNLERAIALLEEVRSGGVLGLGGNDRIAVRRLEQAGNIGLASELEASSLALSEVQWWDLDIIINDPESHDVLQKWNATVSSKRAAHNAVVEKAAAALDQHRVWEPPDLAAVSAASPRSSDPLLRGRPMTIVSGYSQQASGPHFRWTCRAWGSANVYEGSTSCADSVQNPAARWVSRSGSNVR